MQWFPFVFFVFPFSGGGPSAQVKKRMSVQVPGGPTACGDFFVFRREENNIVFLVVW